MLSNDALETISETLAGLSDLLGPTASSMIEDLLADVLRQREKIRGLQALIQALCADAAVDSVDDLRKFIALRRSVSYNPEDQ